MRIAIEALGIHAYGGRTATLNLLQALFGLDRDNEYLLILSQPEPLLTAPNVQHWIIPTKNRFAMRLWAQMVLPWLAYKYDLVHFAKNLGVFCLRTSYIVTVYDMATLLYPKLFPRIDVWYWRYIEKRVLWKANKIIAISHQTAKDIQAFYGIPADRIVVIYLASGRNFRPVDKAEVARVRAIYGLPEHYVLYVGRITPIKNIPLLIEAFAYFRKLTAFPGTLVIVGEQYKKKPDLTIYKKISLLGLEENVQLLGLIPDAHLSALYSGAMAVVLPSIYEGFGLVALEALACGAPLIVNQAGAVLEVVGDAALIMEQNTAECLAELLVRLWKSPEIRKHLREMGLARATQFSWEETARQILMIYEKVGDKR